MALFPNLATFQDKAYLHHMFSNNQLTVVLTKDLQYHVRKKHIHGDFHFIHWIIECGSVCLVYSLVANTLTKALPSTTVKDFVIELGLSMVCVKATLLACGISHWALGRGNPK